MQCSVNATLLTSLNYRDCFHMSANYIICSNPVGYFVSLETFKNLFPGD